MKYIGWLVYNREDAEKNQPYIDWMLEEASSLNINLLFILKEDLLYGVKDNQLFVAHHGQQVTLPDFAIMRNIGELFTKQLEFLGVPVFNHSSVSEVANHKGKTHQRLVQANIPMIDTIFVKRTEFSINSLPFSYPVVLKEVQGRSGKQVFAAHNKKELGEIMEKVSSPDLIIQKMSDAPGKDLRVFVIGKDIMAAILRYSSTDFKANFTLGGEAKLYTLKEEEKQLVSRIIDQFEGKLGLVGIDFIFQKDGSLLFNEIEDVVGSRTVSANTNINTVRLYLQHILSQIS